MPWLVVATEAVPEPVGLPAREATGLVAALAAGSRVEAIGEGAVSATATSCSRAVDGPDPEET